MIRVFKCILAVLGFVLAMGVVTVPAHAAPVLCGTIDSTRIQDNRYIVQNNIWGASTPQCIDVDQSGGFTITQAGHNKPTNGAPASYPSVFAGCHYTLCTSGSGMPMRADSAGFGAVRSAVSMTYPSSGVWDAAYDVWFDPTPRTDGQNTGAELMIWLNKQGSIQPVGQPVATVSIAGGTWQVWFGNIGWNVVSYVRTSPATSLDFTVDSFYSDMVNRGYAQRSWYMTSVQAGFEPWVGGAGLRVNSFSYTTSGGSNDTQAPSVPTNLAAANTTANGTSLTWSPSSDNVAVTGYEVLRATGDGSFAQVGTAGSASYTDTGLSPATTYRYQVRARDAAGNRSAVSGTATVTTQNGGGGGACTVTPVTQSQWGTGYVIQPTVTNTGSTAISGWKGTFTLPSGHTITGSWNATLTGAPTVSFANAGHNGALAPGATTNFGFQVSRPDGDTRLPSGYTCG